jgi:hypothetical protein
MTSGSSIATMSHDTVAIGQIRPIATVKWICVAIGSVCSNVWSSIGYKHIKDGVKFKCLMMVSNNICTIQTSLKQMAEKRFMEFTDLLLLFMEFFKEFTSLQCKV